MKKDKKIVCFRCGAKPLLMLDMGMQGKIHLCAVCWIGLAGAMARDFHAYKNFDTDYVQDFTKAYQREEEMDLRYNPAKKTKKLNRKGKK